SPPEIVAERIRTAAGRRRSPAPRSSRATGGAAGQDGLQRQAQHNTRGAADEVVPEVADVEREVHHDHHRLRGDRREEDGAAADESAAANSAATSKPTTPCGSCVTMNVMKT